MKDQARRSLLKAISWRIIGSIDTFLLAWIITGELAMAGTIATIESISKIILFYIHERIWNKIPFGKYKL